MDAARLDREFRQWIERLEEPLDARMSGRLARLMLGMVLARRRQTAAAWLRAAGVRVGWQRFYYLLDAVGRKSQAVAARLLWLALERLGTPERFERALDDTPTERAGPKVQGAGVHHNPTPGPAGQEYVYGLVFVVLTWLVPHPRWGTVSLPLRALLYICQADLDRSPELRRAKWTFQTKLDQAAELLRWFAGCVARLQRPLQLVCDGAYAKRPLLRAAAEVQATVISRLRRDAALYEPPRPERVVPGRPKKPGPKPKYGKQRLSLAKRAAHPSGWQTGVWQVYGRSTPKRYKTFLAAWRPAGGVIRVVILAERHGPQFLFSTDPAQSAQEIVEAFSRRFQIEQTFAEVKEVHGAGRQQTRRVWSSVGCFHLTLWLKTLVELWSWDRPHSELVDRRDRPWDDPDRRPSHSDRLSALRRHCLEHSIPRTGLSASLRVKFLRLLRLAA